MARISSSTGLGLADLGELSEAQLAAVAEVAREEQRRREWSQDTELLAGAVELLQHIAARLDAGIVAALVEKTGRLPEQARIARPEWMTQASAPTEASGEVVMSPREFARYALRR